MTTVFPATSAAPVGPPVNAKGKLNGLTISQTPYGRNTDVLVESNPVSGSLPIGLMKPLFSSIICADQYIRSAVSCTSPRDSMRFLPTSSAIAAPSSKMRFSIMEAALRTSWTRFCHGVWLQPGNALRAASIAVLACDASPFCITASTQSVFTGERSSNLLLAKTSLPSMIMPYSLPRLALSFTTALSKPLCISSGGLNMLPYVSLKPAIQPPNLVLQSDIHQPPSRTVDKLTND